MLLTSSCSNPILISGSLAHIILCTGRSCLIHCYWIRAGNWAMEQRQLRQSVFDSHAIILSATLLALLYRHTIFASASMKRNIQPSWALWIVLVQYRQHASNNPLTVGYLSSLKSCLYSSDEKLRTGIGRSFVWSSFELILQRQNVKGSYEKLCKDGWNGCAFAFFFITRVHWQSISRFWLEGIQIFLRSNQAS